MDENELVSVRDYLGKKLGENGPGLDIYNFAVENKYPIGQRDVRGYHKPIRLYSRKCLDHYFRNKNKK